MPELEIPIAEHEGRIIIKIGTKVARISPNDIPLLIDGILRAAKLATEHNKIPKLFVPGEPG